MWHRMHFLDLQHCTYVFRTGGLNEERGYKRGGARPENGGRAINCSVAQKCPRALEPYGYIWMHYEYTSHLYKLGLK